MERQSIRSKKAAKAAKNVFPMDNINFRRVFDTLHESCVIIGFDWNCLYLNEAAGNGRRENLIGRPAVEMYSIVEQAEIFAHYRECMEKRTPQRFESSFTFADGTVKLYELSVSPVPEGILVLSRDVTDHKIFSTAERKQVEEDLQASETRFATIFDSSSAPLSLSRLSDGLIVSVNSAWEELTGFKKEEAIGRRPTDLHTWENPSERDRLVQMISKAKAIRGYEMRMRRKSGEIAQVLISVERVFLANQQYMVATMIDITARRQAEAELRSYTEDLQIINAVNEAVNRGESIQEIGEVFVKYVHDFFYCNSAAIYLLTPDRQFIEMQSATTPKKVVAAIEQMLGRPLPDVRLPFEKDSYFDKLLADPNGVLLNDPQEIQTWMEQIAETTSLSADLRAASKKLIPQIVHLIGIRSSIILPLLSAGQVVGMIDLHSDISFTTRHLERLRGIAAQIAAAILRRQAEIALRESEEKYRGLMESLENVVAAVDQEGRFLYMNQVAAGQLGQPAKDLVGKTMEDLFPKAVADRQLEYIQKAIREDRALVMENPSSIAGKPHWYKTTIQPVHDLSGKVLYVLINSTDIDELKRIQQELQEVNQSLEAKVTERTAQVQDLYDNAPVGYHSLDASGNFVAINQTELNWLGCTREELLGKPLTMVITPQSREIVREQFPQVKASGTLKDLELEFVRKDGSTFPVLANATAIYDADGNFLASRTTLTDITRRKRVEYALRASEEQNRLLFEESPGPVMLLNAEGVVVRANLAYQKLTGLALEQLVGSAACGVHLLPAGGRDRLRDLPSQAASAGSAFVSVEYTIQDANGREIDVASRIFPITLQGSEHFLITTTDISAYKKTEELLRQANVELQRAMAMKNEFMANMSHELRTPLTGILAATETLLLQVGGPLNERQEKYLHNIEASGRRLLSLINNILDLSRIEAGKIDLQSENLSAGDVCQASLGLVKQTALKKNIELVYRCEPAILSFVADARRLKQILVNLLSNAVKFTPSNGQVSLTVKADPQQALIRFEVADTGIGIAAQDLDRLFTPFTQMDSGLSRQYEGAGLGLALVKRLTEMLGGQVSVTSEVGKGSRFTVTIPWRQNLEALAAPTDSL